MKPICRINVVTLLAIGAQSIQHALPGLLDGQRAVAEVVAEVVQHVQAQADVVSHTGVCKGEVARMHMHPIGMVELRRRATNELGMSAVALVALDVGGAGLDGCKAEVAGVGADVEHARIGVVDVAREELLALRFQLSGRQIERRSSSAATIGCSCWYDECLLLRW